MGKLSIKPVDEQYIAGRRVCGVVGCNNLSELRERKEFKCKSVAVYRLLCTRHRRHGKDHKEYKAMTLTLCTQCGSTDRLARHRINGQQSSYTIDNVRILCFKCHYDIHRL